MSVASGVRADSRAMVCERTHGLQRTGTLSEQNHHYPRCACALETHWRDAAMELVRERRGLHLHLRNK